ncbi:MAG TPA: glycosyltransferase family 4 protein [Planctomycetota bacterium]|nr:glycosyltransferase family 4 protein [Planctomycetota bacterium]
MFHTLRILQLNSARKYVGEAAHALNLTEALRRRGHAVWLGLRKGYETYDRAVTRNLEPIGFHMPHSWWWPPKNMSDVRAIVRLVRAEKINLIHAHRGTDHWLAVFASRMAGLGVPVVRTRHVVTPLKNHLANRWLARRTAALIAVSKAVEYDVRHTGMFEGPRLAFIPSGIDMSLFNPATKERRAAAREALGISPDAPAAICVARFAAVKAHRVLLDAWRLVRAESPAAMLLLVGAGKFFEESKVLAASLGVQDSVLFLGKRHDVPMLLDAADAGVLASVGSEGFSRAVLEYMAAALPVAATRVGAVPDLIEEGVHGKLAPPENAEALAGALIGVLSAPLEQRRTWGRAAYEKAEQGYSYATWAEAHEKLYAQLLSDQRA